LPGESSPARQKARGQARLNSQINEFSGLSQGKLHGIDYLVHHRICAEGNKSVAAGMIRFAGRGAVRSSRREAITRREMEGFSKDRLANAFL
jgi:hypothetical protein